MKKLIKDWWPLLLLAGWWLWKRCQNKKKTHGGKAAQTVTLHDGTVYVVPDVCPRCGSPVDHTGGGNKSLVAKCTNKECPYKVYYPKEGHEAGTCELCGSMQHYRVVRSSVDGCSIINKAVCDNPKCRSKNLDY
jgi:hypothetical protein